MSTHHKPKRHFDNRQYFFIFIAVAVVAFFYVQWSINSTYSGPDSALADTPSTITGLSTSPNTPASAPQTSAAAPTPDYIFVARVADTVGSDRSQYHAKIIQNRINNVSGTVVVQVPAGSSLTFGTDYKFAATYDAYHKVYDVVSVSPF